MIAYNHFKSDEDFDALLLMTPVIPNEKYETALYPGLADMKRPAVIALGASDSDNCPLAQLYNTLNKGVDKIPVIVVPGDHGLNVGDWQAPEFQEINADNIAVTVQVLVQWMKAMTKTY